MEANSTKDESQDKRELILSKKIGSRLREAREMCQFTQKTAARLLGVDQLTIKALEGSDGPDNGYIPLLLIADCAKLYDVSIDYLFGLTDDFETGPDKPRFDFQALNFIVDAGFKSRANLLNNQRKLDNKINAVAESIKTLITAVKAADDGFMRFWELNPDFDQMPAGSMFINRLDAAINIAREAACRLVRNRVFEIEYLHQFDPDQVRQNPHEAHEKQPRQVSNQANRYGREA
ncbi:helix-turn-helix transcriptional regulator [Methylomonas sp. HYX-M1]|uniref:helix-turn-helix transcriptional regulator n=1 Tax=Methylomonas sp. HYX-M1 TaxID=3139307 RepID=UPI00345B5914